MIANRLNQLILQSFQDNFLLSNRTIKILKTIQNILNYFYLYTTFKNKNKKGKKYLLKMLPDEPRSFIFRNHICSRYVDGLEVNTKDKHEFFDFIVEIFNKSTYNSVVYLFYVVLFQVKFVDKIVTAGPDSSVVAFNWSIDLCSKEGLIIKSKEKNWVFFLYYYFCFYIAQNKGSMVFDGYSCTEHGLRFSTNDFCEGALSFPNRIISIL